MYHEVVLLGILVSLAFGELTGLSAGLIVPGYLVLSLHSPRRLLYTLLLAALCTLVLRLLSRYLILYGRRRFALLLALAFLLDWALSASGLLGSAISPIGLLVPGIIAREFDRQGFADTLLSLAATVGILAAILAVLGRFSPGVTVW